MVFYEGMSAEAQKGLVEHMNPGRSRNSFYQIQALGGAVAEVAADTSAFPYGNATMIFQVSSGSAYHTRSGDTS
jgi:hypothetical protein